MSIYIQPASNTTIPASGAIQKTLIKTGDTVSVDADILSNPKGTFITGYGYVISANVDRSEGEVSTVTYLCSESPITSTAGLEDETQLTDVWSLSSTQVDIHIESFCGISPGQDPSLWHIERWKKEPDYVLYNQYKFKDARSNVIYDLDSDSNSKTVTMAMMIRSGVESAIRFYPIVSHQRTFKSEPTITAKLGYIDAPSKWAGQALAWLKVKEDIAENSDGTYTVTEAWQGADKWWTQLYGSARWPIGGYQGT